MSGPIFGVRSQDIEGPLPDDLSGNGPFYLDKRRESTSMDRQEWFEKYGSRIAFEEERYRANPQILFEEWKALRIILIKMATDQLPRLEKRIIILTHYYGFSERKVAEKLKISRARVQRKKKKAIKTLLKSDFARLLLRHPDKTF
ncbi:hypothetical protein A2311_03050 [candidate division WOR-1 bacterium RIFOXYB2_FULL_48_7]|uniref:RNA polymerase sigma factor 70 region 4 type 2 domain-containing protein n=1 Tax=candidate division WOR-1 bacterium RIFOXYB2_FULL_48_7 TaxID=1802583 RepID=A0A1F4TUW2_UNCSA|nr:MAG: hypothetical protein A2311_03050 [candidate division WOR-1 bacterium RIFOXYB2_FULL_48_7]